MKKTPVEDPSKSSLNISMDQGELDMLLGGDGGDQVLAPKAWQKLNADTKKAKMEKKAKGKAAKVPKIAKAKQLVAKQPVAKVASQPGVRKGPDKNLISVKVFVHRLHSKAWHRERKHCLQKLGLEPVEAKKRASDVAKVVVQKFWQDKAAGKLDEAVVSQLEGGR